MKILGQTDVKPFTIVKVENEEGKQYYFIACGKIRTEKQYETFEEAEKCIKRKDWELICLVIENYGTWLSYLNDKNK